MVAEHRWFSKFVLSLGMVAGLGPVVGLVGLPGAAGAVTPGGGPAASAGYAGPAVGVTEGPLMASGSSQFTSRNWDGYVTYDAARSTDFDHVSATWVQPTVICETNDAWTVFWVGLDGWFDGTVEQGGSSARCGTAGTVPTYKLWWEMYPTNAITTVLKISAGDTVHASVTYDPSTSAFVIHVKDETTGQGFTRKELCASGAVCARSSADVVAEDVGHFSGSTFFPLADYATMGYTAAHVVDTSGSAGSLSNPAWLNAAVTESSGGVTYATVSTLFDHGRAFDATWQHS